ncbi:hypothetical protein Hanom_Chr17g01542291 [Helianthus anomalus]
MATSVATIAAQSGFNEDDDLFRFESIGVELFNVRVVLMVMVELFDNICGNRCLHINFRLTLPQTAGVKKSSFHSR